MGSMSRNKGQAGEREIAAILSAELGVRIDRKLSASRDGGDDLAASGSDDVLGWSIEVKRTELFAHKFLEQAENQANGKPWALFWRRSRMQWNVYLDLHFVSPEYFPRKGHLVQMTVPAWCQLVRESI